MKKIAKWMTCILSVVVLYAGISVPGMAAVNSDGDTVAVAISEFPTQSTYSYTSGYTTIIQRFLCLYSSQTRSLVEDSGGIDGRYGSGTVAAVLKFQNLEGLSSDGVFGVQCWTYLGKHLSRLTTSSTGSYFVYKTYGMLRLVDMKDNSHVQKGTKWYYYSSTELTNYNFLIPTSYEYLRTET